jgi:tetratricopeptide (TPR) repeat protein/DNA-binding XRE family transcriptional regulator
MGIAQGAFGSVLHGLRERERIKQGELARQLNVHRNTVGAWERGDYLPDLTTVHEIARLLYLSEDDADRLFAAHSSRSPQIVPWNLPSLRNLFFTGREELLQQLHEALQTANAGAAYTLSGLGGIGKTQTALEYAYRFQDEYRSIFWFQSETYETLFGSYLAIADILDLPEKGESDHTSVVKAVKRWLNTHVRWLLIYDNVEDFELLLQMLPTVRFGAILLTTRAQASGSFFQSLKVEAMALEEATLFLLRRAKILQETHIADQYVPDEYEKAATLAEQLGKLPLALDQAGAYIEENSCLLGDYLALYQTHRPHLLGERGSIGIDHPHSVRTTFRMAFEQVQKHNPAAADVLRLCAFLAPDAIPQELILQAVAEPDPSLPSLLVAPDTLTFNTIFKDLARYSLLQRHPVTSTLSLHRLVQDVLKDEMDLDTRLLWVKRTIDALNQLFPSPIVDIEKWPLCERLLPHVIVCANLSEQWHFVFSTAPLLFQKAAHYLQERSQHAEAVMLAQQALAMQIQLLGTEHLDIAESLTNLGILYRKQARYAEAEQVYRQALEIRQRLLGMTHTLISESLQNLAIVARYQEKYAEAEVLLQRTLAIEEQESGPDHLENTNVMSLLALIYADQDKYTEAELLHRRVLAIHEQVVGAFHLRTAISLDRLAAHFCHLGKYQEAEPLYQRALKIREQQLGSDHVLTAHILGSIARLYSNLGRYEEAERLMQQVLARHEQTLGSDHHDTLFYVLEMARVFYAQGKYEDAVSLCQRALLTNEHTSGSHHGRKAECFTLLGEIYQDQKKFLQAETFLRQALEIYEHILSSSRLPYAVALNALGVLYQKQNRYQEAASLIQQALALRENLLGSSHPQVAESLYNLAQLNWQQGRSTEAEEFLQRALSIAQQTFGSDHPLTRKILQNRPHLPESAPNFMGDEPPQG